MSVVGQPLLRMTVEMTVRDCGEHLAHQPVSQRSQPRRLRRLLLRGDLGGFGHADDRRQLLRSCTQAALLAATHGDRRQTRALTNVECPQPLRAVYVIAGESKEVYRHLSHVDG